MNRELQNIIAGAARGGWEWFDELPVDVRAKVDLGQQKVSEDAKTIAAAWARFAATPDGEKALMSLFDVTLHRSVYFVGLGTDPLQVAQFGAFREGQNSVADLIRRLIFKGQGEEAPKPRDV